MCPRWNFILELLSIFPNSVCGICICTDSPGYTRTLRRHTWVPQVSKCKYYLQMLEELQENPIGGQRQQYSLVFTFCPSRRWQDWKRQRKGTKKGWEIQVQLTTRSSQQAVEGSFLLIPKKTSSVPTHCLNKIWYLRKRNSCLIILEKGQETKGGGFSQRTVNILITWSLLLFKALTHLHRVSVQSHDWVS